MVDKVFSVHRHVMPWVSNEEENNFFEGESRRDFVYLSSMRRESKEEMIEQWGRRASVEFASNKEAWEVPVLDQCTVHFSRNFLYGTAIHSIFLCPMGPPAGGLNNSQNWWYL